MWVFRLSLPEPGSAIVAVGWRRAHAYSVLVAHPGYNHTVGHAVVLLAGFFLFFPAWGEGEHSRIERSHSIVSSAVEGISSREPGSAPCTPELRETLLQATEVAIAGRDAVDCARAIVPSTLDSQRGAPQTAGAIVQDARGPTTARVVTWSDEEGWGSLASPQAPGGIFVHFSVIDDAGYRALREGQLVEVMYTQAVPDGEAGNSWVAERVIGSPE